MSRLVDNLDDPDFRTGPAEGYLVTRLAAPVVTDGVAAAPVAARTFRTGPAILRPLRGRSLEWAREAYRATDVRKLITTADLRTLDEVTRTPADVVTVDGEPWTVVQVATTTAFGATHRSVLLARGLR